MLAAAVYQLVNYGRRGKLEVVIPAVSRSTDLEKTLVSELPGLAGSECASVSGLKPATVRATSTATLAVHHMDRITALSASFVILAFAGRRVLRHLFWRVPQLPRSYSAGSDRRIECP